ncbi:DUF1904 family protein [Paenibacillus agilis]|uniref:DUF1904 family protein n=1 Tax=Paenibacillus agilis TaxID=3020863 RepID=A0A559IKM5_9BACL|nr:DUF1904 family protein [Paenibacillus agilis]TVX88216.1 DUF1904 family protein [Paenibacillus agilis]
MPHLIFRGVAAEQLAPVSQQLVEELAELCQCGTDNFTLECLQTTGVWAGKLAPSYPFVEISWFERGTEVRNRFADIVTRHVHAAGVEEVEVAFRTFEPSHYYIQGVPCK